MHKLPKDMIWLELIKGMLRGLWSIHVHYILYLCLIIPNFWASILIMVFVLRREMYQNHLNYFQISLWQLYNILTIKWMRWNKINNYGPIIVTNSFVHNCVKTINVMTTLWIIWFMMVTIKYIFQEERKCQIFRECFLLMILKCI